jgi:hypothetical protein
VKLFSKCGKAVPIPRRLPRNQAIFKAFIEVVSGNFHSYGIKFQQEKSVRNRIEHTSKVFPSQIKVILKAASSALTRKLLKVKTDLQLLKCIQ